MKESRGTGLSGLVTAALLVATAVPAAAIDAESVAVRFAARLALALEGTATDRDRLWLPGARDSTRRLLDFRTESLFDWTDVRVQVESAEQAPDAQWVDAVFVVRGTATWRPTAWAIAESFWTLQLDENAESNHVVRREAWRLVPGGGGWAATQRTPLSGAEVVGVEVSAGVYPGQDAMLVEGSYYLRSLAEGLEVCRFLLDRRAVVYRLVVDGVRVPVARGGELGALGLEGFSSESESSFRLPKPLAKGEETLVTFRIRSPLVHLRGPGFVTTFPIHAGPFRERVWYPTLLPDHLPGTRRSALSRDAIFEVRFPKGALITIDSRAGSARAVSAVDDAAERMEEEVLRYGGVTHYRDLDFFLLEPDVNLDTVDWSDYEFSPFRLLGGGASFLPSLGQAEPSDRPEETWLDPHPRSRRAIVEPLLTAATYSSRDLEAELEELIPFDLQQLDELLDDGASDADAGAGEPARD